MTDIANQTPSFPGLANIGTAACPRTEEYILSLPPSAAVISWQISWPQIFGTLGTSDHDPRLLTVFSSLGWLAGAPPCSSHLMLQLSQGQKFVIATNTSTFLILNSISSRFVAALPKRFVRDEHQT